MDEMVDADSGTVKARYTGLVVAIHWISALLIVGQIILGLKFADMPKGPDKFALFDWHKTIGVAILLLAVARLIVRLTHRPPPFPADFPRWERFVAVWNHRIFYFLMFALPITGLMMVADHAVGGMTQLKFGLPFPVIPLPVPDEAHSLLAWGLIGLLVLHVLAALKQQFFDKTIVADRMPPFHSPRHGDIDAGE